MRPGKHYLCIKILSIDLIVTPDQRPLDQLDTFVEVQYDGRSSATKTVQDSLNPLFNEEIVFEFIGIDSAGNNSRSE